MHRQPAPLTPQASDPKIPLPESIADPRAAGCQNPHDKEESMKRLPQWVFALAVAAGLAAPAAVLAQAYPTKSIRVIVPSVPGVANDLFPRLLAPKIGEALGQSMVVENRPGSSGIVGTEAVARAAPDGYTLAYSSSSQLIAVPLLNKNVPYDAFKDFAPLGAAIAPIELILMSNSVPANSLAEMIALARQKPGSLSFGSAGIGTYFHLVGEAFNMAAGTNILHVPYKASVQAAQDLIGGRLDLTFGTLPSTLPLLSAGKLKVIGVLGVSARIAKLPDVPAVVEVLPNFQKPPIWFAYFAPAQVPQPILDRLNTEILKAMAAPDVVAWIDNGGLNVVANSPQQISTMHKAGVQIFRKVIDAVGLKPE
jgi:tripartite-type tricarboxylate transporter receptor subunit TctC